MKGFIASLFAACVCAGLCSCAEEAQFETIAIKNVSINLPIYWEEEGSVKGDLSYYAEKEEGFLSENIIASLDIEFKEETDPNYNVSFKGLEADNENMMKAIEKKYNDANVLGDEVVESDFGVKGILYKFSLNKSTGLLSEDPAKGYCFCFASESDRRWYYITMIRTNDADNYNYDEDYMKMISSIQCDKK